MPKSSDKKKPDACAPDENSTSRPEIPSRVGKPKRDSILSETPFKSPKGRTYRIIRTNEIDPYDKPVRVKDKRNSNQ